MSNQCKHGIDRLECCECSPHLIAAEALRQARGTCSFMPFVVLDKPRPDEIEASMKEALAADAIDALKKIESCDCTEEVYETIHAAIEDLERCLWQRG